MSGFDVFISPSRWTNQPIRLYHGTTEAHARQITEWGVQIANGRTRTDFGRGFYTTTYERQARAWAWDVTRRRGEKPAVVYADVDRDALAGLDCLSFVRGDFEAHDYWSFVVHCRSGGTDHARSFEGKRHYDVVSGPVTAVWGQGAVIAAFDQISFHTPAAEAVLNLSAWKVLP